MVISIEVKVKGSDTFKSAMARAPEIMKPALIRAGNRSAALLQQRMVKLAPKGATGHLQQFIIITADGQALLWVVGPSEAAPYAGAIEKGRAPGAAGPPYAFGNRPNTALARWAQVKLGWAIDMSDPFTVRPLALSIHRKGFAAQPFMEPAVAQTEAKILEIFNAAVEDVLGQL